MEKVHTIDIDGEQWEIQDKPLNTQVQKKFNYTMGENLTGETWVDGKPIYRLVRRIEHATSSGNVWIFPQFLETYHPDTLIQGFAIVANAPYARTTQANVLWVDTNNYLYFSSTNTIPNNAIIVVEYTKSTD